jgi:glycerol kinase
LGARILAVDAGTTGVRGFVIDEGGRVLGRGYREFTQHFPRPGWVEHDAEEIWEATLAACAEALSGSATLPDAVTCIGITNQRETIVLYERATLRPLHRAIVWQDRRTAGACDALRSAGHETLLRERTGLVLDAYFSGTKAAWLLDNVPGARARAARGDLALATIDTWLVARLTGGAVHVTEPSNASRTLLYDLASGDFSAELCELLDVPRDLLPEVRDSSGRFGDADPSAFLGVSAPITGIAGDQQAALFGQGAWTPGSSKNTYGTGSFLLLNTGSEPVRSAAGLLTGPPSRLGPAAKRAGAASHQARRFRPAPQPRRGLAASQLFRGLRCDSRPAVGGLRHPARGAAGLPGGGWVVQWGVEEPIDPPSPPPTGGA